MSGAPAAGRTLSKLKAARPAGAETLPAASVTVNCCAAFAPWVVTGIGPQLASGEQVRRTLSEGAVIQPVSPGAALSATESVGAVWSMTIGADVPYGPGPPIACTARTR